MREAVVGARADDVARQLTPNPLVVIDSDGIVRSINPSASRLLPLAAVGSRMTHQASWLAEAHDRCAREQGATVSPHLEVAAGPIGDRRYHAHPAIIGIGDVAWSLVEDTGLEARDFEQALGLERQRSAILSEASSSLTAMLNIDRCRSAVASLAARHLADAAVVVARVGLARRLQLVGCESGSSAGVRSADVDARTVPGLCEALDGLPVSSAAWLDPSLLPDWLVPPGLNSPVSSIVIAALPGPGQPAGALVLLRAAGRPAFSADEERFAHVFAARAGAALTAARLYSEQAAVTRTLMHDLLPPQLHRIHGIEYAGGYRAAGDLDVVGGDFYNVHPGSTPQDDTLVVLGDVCGKGLEAAVLSGKIRTTVQALRSLSGEHHTILSLLNESLLSAENTRFATMVLASVHSENDAAVLRLTSAGHLPPLLIRGDGRVHPADTEGTVIGVLPDIKTATYSTSLAPGEACVLYTDGVTEARGGLSGRELFGEQRLATCLRECNGMPAEAIVERVMMQAAGWAGSRTRDDMAVVVITSPQRTHLSAVDGRTRGRYIA